MAGLRGQYRRTGCWLKSTSDGISYTSAMARLHRRQWESFSNTWRTISSGEWLMSTASANSMHQ
ncbi:hypothetical protein D9M71_673320 [compost metagenome]